MGTCEKPLKIRTLLEFGAYYLLPAALIFLKIKKIGLDAAIGKAQTMLPPEITLMMLTGIGVGTVGLVVFEPFREAGKIYGILYRLVQLITIGLMVYALWLFCM